MIRPALSPALWAALLALLAPGVAAAHGTTYRVSSVATTVVEFAYTDGERMGFIPYRLFAPGGAEPMRTGRTDREGRVSFQPEAAGTWRIEAQDEEGHVSRAEVSVAAGGQVAQGSPSLPISVAAASLAFNAIALATMLPRLRRRRAAALGSAGAAAAAAWSPARSR